MVESPDPKATLEGRYPLLRKDRPAAPQARNGFGVLRLAFAALVIVAHVPEMIDGNRSHELFTQWFHTNLSFGDLAVDGFFLISGYLVTGSFVADPRLISYLRKRALRIYPAFIVCSVLLAWVIGPWVGNGIPPFRSFLMRMLTLQEPQRDHAFSGLAYPALDGPMWTLAYEFRCYLIVAALGMAGLYNKPKVYGLLTAAVAALAVATQALPHDGEGYWTKVLIGTPSTDFRLLSAFMIGGCFYLLKPPLKGWLAAVCGVLAILLVRAQPIGEVALVSFGSYAMFWAALSLDWGYLAARTAKTDISYGVYLYAWPITNLLLWWFGDWSPLSILLSTLVGAAALGLTSWTFVERPAVELGRNARRRLSNLSAAIRNSDVRLPDPE